MTIRYYIARGFTSTLIASTQDESEYIMADPEYLSTIQAAAYLGLSRQQLWKLAVSGKMGRKFGGSYFFTIAELDAYKKTMKKKPPQT